MAKVSNGSFSLDKDVVGTRSLCRGNEILCRGNEILCRGNEIIMSWERDLMSWERDLISWERDNYVVGRRSYVVLCERDKYFFSHVPSVLPYIANARQKKHKRSTKDVPPWHGQ